MGLLRVGALAIGKRVLNKHGGPVDVIVTNRPYRRIQLNHDHVARSRGTDRRAHRRGKRKPRMVHVVANEIELRIVLGENAAILEGRQGPLQSETRERRGKPPNLGPQSVRTAPSACLKYRYPP